MRFWITKSETDASAVSAETETTSSRAAGPRTSFLWRLVSSVAFLPILWYLIRIGSWPYLIFLFLIVIVGAREWELLLRRTGLRPWPMWMLLVAVGFFASGLQEDAWRYMAVLAFLLLGGLTLELARRTGKTVALLGGTLLGGLYVGLLPAFLFRIRALPGDGNLAMHATYLLFLVVWGCDTLAYTVGRLLGRHRFWPQVSPGKSWEGALGGAFGAVLLAVLAQRWFAGFLTVREALVFGLLAGVLAQVGDLAESLLKREAGLKDTSSLIPGHGGIMDRFDSLLFSTPFLYGYLLLRLQSGGH